MSQQTEAQRLTFEDRCKISTDCLPKSPYRTRLESLHAEMTKALRGAVPALNAMAKRRIYGAIRDAYDIGYSDARNAGARAGDSAPGYKGRDIEQDHGGALFSAINAQLAAAPQPAPVQNPAWEIFPAYLIDKCEGEIITEEGLQRSMAAMLVDPAYAAPSAPQPAAQPTYGSPELEQLILDRLAQPAAQQEPVGEVVMAQMPPKASPAWLPFKTVYASLKWLDSVPVGTKLYTRPAVPLTYEQIAALHVWRYFVGLMPEHHIEITRAIEAAHKIGGAE